MEVIRSWSNRRQGIGIFAVAAMTNVAYFCLRHRLSSDDRSLHGPTLPDDTQRQKHAIVGSRQVDWAQRQRRNASLHLDHHDSLVSRRLRCDKCWMSLATSTSNCFCDALRPITTSTVSRIHLFMHFKEVGRSSNSAKILLQSCIGTELYVYGRCDDERRLLEFLANNSDSVVLFPSANASNLSDFVDGEYGTMKRKIRNLVVLDGTWSQVRMMNRRIPSSVLRVKLTVKEIMGRAEMRKLSTEQQKTGRASTAEAVIGVLQVLGEEQANIDQLSYSFNQAVKAYAQQKPKHKTEMTVGKRNGTGDPRNINNNF